MLMKPQVCAPHKDTGDMSVLVITKGFSDSSISFLCFVLSWEFSIAAWT